MQILNIKVENTSERMEPIYDSYKDNLNNVLDSNIDDMVASIINTNSCPLRQITLATQSKMFFDILFLLRLFSKIASNKDKNSSLSTKKSSLLTLLLSIVLKKLSNLLLRLFDKYDKLKK